MAARSNNKYLDPKRVPLKPRGGQGNVWAVLTQITQMLAMLGVVALIVLGFLPVIAESQKLQEKKASVAAEIQLQKTLYLQKRQEVELIKSDPEYAERLARDALNLGRPGEVIFRFDPYVVPEPSAPAPSP